uniref:Neurochondrin isoform X1 n=1 Tax=Nicotiana tabacum TaxID=4097 RepID=A0A1S4BVW8_TOBAC|nr:PREDICTED: neurochondrin-like isoform X1 [Nicotiana tabacum]
MEEQASSSGASSSSSSQPQPHSQPSLDDCLKLLRGERDEQRLAGLLLVTKFCNKDDHAAIRMVYDAVGPQFLHRLLRTGTGKGSDRPGDNRDAYLQLSITVLAAFCRVPEIAASEDMVTKIPLIVEIMSAKAGSPIIEECYEFLFLVSAANEEGVKTLYDSGGLHVVASRMSILPDGSHMIELAMRLVQIIVIKLPSENVYSEHPADLSMVLAAVAKQFAVLQNALKFEALHLLSTILSNSYFVLVYDALRLMKNDVWSTNMRIGIVAILQNRVAPSHKLQALILAESVISIVGEGWLIGEMNLTDSMPADRCILLVLESSRVEIAVLLNDLAYLKYEASKESSNRENILVKQRNLGVAFSLVEKIIKLISSFGGEESTANAVISESTFTKIISGLNETIGVVLDYLRDAKEHGQMKGDDLLAAVRVIGSYLAEAPHACKDKVTALLGYMLSIEGEDELSPFYSICFLLPMLCQITLKTGGCKILASSGAFREVAGCLIALIEQNNYTSEDNGSIFLACDTVLNLLLKREQIKFPSDDPSFIRLLVALLHWAEGTDDASIVMMASSICSLILDLKSEEALLNHPDFAAGNITSLSKLIGRSFAMCGQDLMSDDAKAEVDLFQIISSAYSSWADRFPRIRQAVESSRPFPFRHVS